MCDAKKIDTLAGEFGTCSRLEDLLHGAGQTTCGRKENGASEEQFSTFPARESARPVSFTSGSSKENNDNSKRSSAWSSSKRRRAVPRARLFVRLAPVSFT